jgi:superoxide dismutase, Cu-Zn family
MQGWYRSRLAASLAAVALSLLSSGPASALGEAAFAELKLTDGKDLGRVEVVETSAGVLLRVKLKGLPPGPHGFHFMQVGKCEGDFKSTGGILNPLRAKHGFLHEEGPMMGNLPNLIITQKGEVEVELLSPFLTLSKDSEDSLFDGDGSALVVRERPDDHKSQPDGKSGGILACGVLVPAK